MKIWNTKSLSRSLLSWRRQKSAEQQEAPLNNGEFLSSPADTNEVTLENAASEPENNIDSYNNNDSEDNSNGKKTLLLSLEELMEQPNLRFRERSVLKKVLASLRKNHSEASKDTLQKLVQLQQDSSSAQMQASLEPIITALKAKLQQETVDTIAQAISQQETADAIAQAIPHKETADTIAQAVPQQEATDTIAQARRSWIERGIKEKLIKFDDEHIIYIHQEKKYRYEPERKQPERKIQAEAYVKLVLHYGYAPKRIEIEAPVTIGSKHDYKADIIVYNDDEHTSAHIVVECKTEKVSKEAIQQAFSYAILSGASYFWVTSNIENAYFKMLHPNKRDDIPDIPKAGDSFQATPQQEATDIMPQSIPQEEATNSRVEKTVQEKAADTVLQTTAQTASAKPSAFIVDLTYDFSQIPDSFRLSGQHNFLSEAYYRYKSMLIRAQELSGRQMFRQALDYYRVVQAQNIPMELRQMIGCNIKDIVNYQKEFLLRQRSA